MEADGAHLNTAPVEPRGTIVVVPVDEWFIVWFAGVEDGC